MSVSNARERSREQVFENTGSPAGNPTAMLLGGLALIAFAIAAFIVALVTRPGTMTLHLTTTMPVIIALGLFSQWSSLRSLPSRIVVGPDAIEVTTKQSTRRYFWSEIGTATTANVAMSNKTCLRITDLAGKTIIRVDESLPNYQHLVALVQSFIEAKPDDTAVSILARKANRNGAVCFVFGCFLATAAVFIAITTHSTQRANELLAAKGVPGEAEIIRRFVAPNGVTKRIEFRVPGGEVKNVEVDPTTWERLAEAKTVPVIYVPDEPDISRLESGEVEDDDDFTKTPRGGYLLAGLGGLGALFMLAFSPLAWMGYDLTYDDKLGLWKVKRHGRVVWQSKD